MTLALLTRDHAFDKSQMYRMHYSFYAEPGDCGRGGDLRPLRGFDGAIGKRKEKSGSGRGIAIHAPEIRDKSEQPSFHLFLFFLALDTRLARGTNTMNL